MHTKRQDNLFSGFVESKDVHCELEENQGAEARWMRHMLDALENVMGSYADITQHCQEVRLFSRLSVKTFKILIYFRNHLNVSFPVSECKHENWTK